MKNLKPVYLLIVVLFSVFMASCSNLDTDTKVIYLVRHAEKDLTDTTDNPALTVAGIERSNQLVKTLGVISINGFYSTKYQRNLNTLKPLANANEKEIQIYEWHDWKPMLVNIKKNEDNVFIICGHGNNLLPMITYLGATPPIDELGHHEYDNLFKVIISKDKTVVELIKY